MVYFSLIQRDQEYMHLVVQTADAGEAVAAAVPAMLTAVVRGAGSAGPDLRGPSGRSAHARSDPHHGGDRVRRRRAGAGHDRRLRRRRRRGPAPHSGDRTAGGARGAHASILQLVFGEGVPLSAVGSAVGIVSALLISRVMRTFVDDLPSVDLVSLAVVPLALLFVVAGAAVLPLRRALRLVRRLR